MFKARVTDVVFNTVPDLWLGEIKHSKTQLAMCLSSIFPLVHSQFTAHVFALWNQKGLMRSPVPRGEKGLTLAHIRASLREIADLPSSNTNTGPFISGDRETDIRKHATSIKTSSRHAAENLYSVSGETGQLHVRVARQVGARHVVGAKQDQ